MIGSGRFVYQFHSFTGPKVIRVGPSVWHYDLRIDVGGPTILHFVLATDLIGAEEVEVLEVKRDRDRRVMTAEGTYKPGTFMNPTKRMIAEVIIEDKGPATVFIDTPSIKRFELRGKRLRGLYLAQRPPKQPTWRLRRTGTVGERLKALRLLLKDFL
jgi:hypothetical protein